MIAHRKTGGYVILPEIVARNQAHFSERKKPFKAHRCDQSGKPIDEKYPQMYVLRGDLYGLGTTVTGDPVVTTHSYRRKA